MKLRELAGGKEGFDWKKYIVIMCCLPVMLLSACGNGAKTATEDVLVTMQPSQEVEVEGEPSLVAQQVEGEPSLVAQPLVAQQLQGTSASQPTVDSTPQPTVAPTPTPAPQINLVMVGDMLMHERVVESGLQEDGSYNFDHLFEHVQEKIEAADLALVNQETILGGMELGLSGYPCFNSPYELGTAEVEAGFDVILHGTNHALDKGKKGALNCMDFWAESYPEIAYLGINYSQEAQDNDIYVYEQDGIRIAILNYTYGTNGISTPSDMPYLVNYMEEEKVIADIQKAEEIADFTVVCPHWGNEYYLGVASTQKYWTKLFLEQGVDLVLGTHPHVIEPVEWVFDDAGHEMLVYYSLGNFINGTSGTGEGVMNRCVGALADVTIGRDENGEVVILEYDAVPLVCHIAEGEEYTVWYLEDYTQELAQENLICSQDETFSLENCEALVEQVWGVLQMN